MNSTNSKTSKISNQFALYSLLGQRKEFKDASNKSKEVLLYLRENFRTLLESRCFAILIMIVIVLNSVCMALETLYTAEQKPFVLVFLDHSFNIVYHLEFSLKLFVMRTSYFKNPWNWFDISTLLIIHIDLIGKNWELMDSSSAFYKAIRSLKAFRTLKAVSFVQGLQVILSALLKTLSNSVINVIIVTLLIMFIFSIIANSLFAREEWSSLKNCMWTLFRYICGDEWPEIQKNIDGFAGSRIFTIFFVFIGNFIFANIFIGLIIMNISEAQVRHQRQLQEDKTRRMRQKKENILKKQVDELSKYFGQSAQNQFVGKNFCQMVNSYYDNLSHSNDLIWPRKLCANLTWMKSFLNTCKMLDDQLMIVKKLHVQMSNCLAALTEERLVEEKHKLA
ncbi:cation channel sperm-associated 3-like [Brachionus plicatilis]|uniref:Cation channel sperm-associated 3-like n=1 Tax=Brachionus plicatilis TaxID=10195 RepID=A0A3M7RBG2_BRAPC|nr:cation channel sperm-associated 3-like [Brachionus plicatilis]